MDAQIPRIKRRLVEGGAFGSHLVGSSAKVRVGRRRELDFCTIPATRSQELILDLCVPLTSDTGGLTWPVARKNVQSSAEVCAENECIATRGDASAYKTSMALSPTIILDAGKS